MAASFAPAAFASLLKQNEELVKANLQLKREVNASKKYEFKHEILAKHLGTRIEELEAAIKTQTAGIDSWAEQVDQTLVNVSRQIEATLTKLRARPTGNEASLPQRISVAINQPGANPAQHGVNDPFSFSTMASNDAPNMNRTHRPLFDEAIPARNPEPLLTRFGKPNEQNLVQPSSVIYAESKLSIRPQSAPVIPPDVVKRVKSPFNVFKGLLEDSIHAIPRINRPRYGGVHDRFFYDDYDEYDESTHSHVDHWLEDLKSPSKAVERTQWTPRLQLSTTAPEGVVPQDVVQAVVPKYVVSKDVVPQDVMPQDVVSQDAVQTVVAKDVESKDVESKDVESKDVESKDVVLTDVMRDNVEGGDVVAEDVVADDVVPQGAKKHDGSLGTSKNLLREYQPSRAKPYIYLGGTTVKKYSPKVLQQGSRAERTKPLPSEMKVDQSIHPQLPVLSRDKSTDQADRPIVTQISSVNLPQATEKHPTPDDSVNVELSESSSQELGLLISVGLPKHKKDRNINFSPLTSSDPFFSLLDHQSNITTTSKYPALSPTKYKTVSPRPSTAITFESLATNSSKQSPMQTDASLKLNPAEASSVNSYKDITRSGYPVESTYKILSHSSSLPAATHRKTLGPSESSLAPTYKVMDDAKPSHILYEEMISASNAFSEKIEAQRKAAMDHKPAKEESDSVKVEMPEELKPTNTRILGSVLDAQCKELVLKPTTVVGRRVPRSQPIQRPIHLKFERVVVELRLPSGATKCLGHLDQPAMANAEICMHMYISETETTSITFEAQIHSTGNEFLVLTATQVRPALEFNVNFILPGQLNTDAIDFRPVRLNKQDDFPATTSLALEIENYRHPITKRLSGSLRRISFAFSPEDVHMEEQGDLPNCEDYQEFEHWDPEAVTFFDFLRSFIGPGEKIVTMWFTNEKYNASYVDAVMDAMERNSCNKRVWRNNGVTWEHSLDAKGEVKWMLAR
ncbi:hypothetical protein MMC07_002333 [Pseudocyphellaria aurata]|nr:hypothetical protein [Pseudocyphellaria aurata]